MKNSEKVRHYFTSRSYDYGKLGWMFPFLLYENDEWVLVNKDKHPYQFIYEKKQVYWNHNIFTFNEDTILLSSINVSHRGMGLGDFFMRTLIDKCDENKVDIRIQLKPYGKMVIDGKRRMNKRQLTKWYRGYDFKIIKVPYDDDDGFRKHR